MLERLVIPLLLLAAVPGVAAGPTPATELRDYAGYRLLRVTPSSQDQMDVLRKLESVFAHHEHGGLEVWKESGLLSEPTDVLISPTLLPTVSAYIQGHGLTVDTHVDDMGAMLQKDEEEQKPMRAYARVLNAPPTIGSEGSKGGAEGMDLNVYHSYDEVMAFLNATAERNEDRVVWDSLGKSFEGRDLAYLKVSCE